MKLLHLDLFESLETLFQILYIIVNTGSRGGAVEYGSTLQAGMSRVRLDSSSRTTTLGLIPASGRLSLGVKGGRYGGMTTLPLSCAHCLEILRPPNLL